MEWFLHTTLVEYFLHTTLVEWYLHTTLGEWFLHTTLVEWYLHSTSGVVYPYYSEVVSPDYFSGVVSPHYFPRINWNSCYKVIANTHAIFLSLASSRVEKSGTRDELSSPSFPLKCSIKTIDQDIWCRL